MTRMEVNSPILMVESWWRAMGVFGGIFEVSKTVPFEESRSLSIHLPDSLRMERCLEEIPGSLMGRVLPFTTRPIRTADPGLKSRVSPWRGPCRISSRRIEASSSISK
ncbi:hypothetical protein V8G54_002662 [Vigna mungo]|uniref:Uncharacterized protein n=1 Tax=Vigna mungo TaxID=3915 RepID=A0AAQ3P9N7_VIGMU